MPTPAAVPQFLPVLTAAMPPLPLSKTFLAGPLPQFHFAFQTCDTCGLFLHEPNLACESCHMTEQWKIVVAFDHSTTRFRLDGSPVKGRCGDCHLGTTPQFPMTPKTCNGWQLAKDVHEGRFRRGAREEGCAACHLTAHWETKDFGASDKMMKIYRGVATECVQCR